VTRDGPGSPIAASVVRLLAAGVAAATERVA
jgi:hypothetical protein